MRVERCRAVWTCHCCNTVLSVWHVPLQRYDTVKEGGTLATIKTAGRPVMEEKESGESEPVDLRCAEQPELLSLIISGEEEATQEESDLGGKEKKNVLLCCVFLTAKWDCVAVRATAIVRQPVNPCQGQCHGAAWPLRLCGSYKQRLNSTQAGGPRRTAATQWTAAAQAASYQWVNNNKIGYWNK